MSGQAVVAENDVYDGDQLVAVMNAPSAIQHEYFDGRTLDPGRKWGMFSY